MKTHITLFLTVLFTTLCVAQQGINYKALIKDDNGNVVASQNITVQFQILEGAGMTNVYQETHTPTTDANGLIIINIGEGTTSNFFEYINWGTDDHFLNVQIDTGSGLTDMGTTQFMAVPYALHSETVKSETIKINDLKDAKTTYLGLSLFVGDRAGLESDGTGTNNVGIGYEAMYDNTIGYHNTAIGSSALSYNITGNNNTANGSSTLINNTTGKRNTAVGKSAGKENISGNDNVFIGFESGGNSDSSAAYSNKLYINNRASDNPLIYGEFDTDLIRINGTLEVTEAIDIGIINADVINTVEINTATTGNANMIPIAYGIVESTGNVLSGTGNFIAFLSGNVFVIDVNGTESLAYVNTVCIVTPISTSPRTASTVISDGNGDSDADLNVRIFDASGTQVTTTFQFIIYKL